MTSELNILSNYTKHLKMLVPYYMLPSFTILKSINPIGQPAYLEKMISIQERGCLPQKNRTFEIFTSFSSHKSDQKKTIKIPQGETNLQINLLIDFLRLQLILPNILNKIWNKSFKQFSKLKYQRTEPETRLSRLSHLTSIVVGPTQSVITFVNIAKTTIPLLEPPILIQFCLRLFFFEIKSISIDSSTKSSQKEKVWFQLPRISSKRFFTRSQETHRALLIATRPKSREILSISYKKSQIALYLEHLQAVLKEFDSTTAFNKETLI